MGKYIIKLEEGETAYKTVDLNGMPLIQLLSLTPYDELDLDTIRKEAYDRGFKDGIKECINCEDFKENAKAEAYQKGLEDAWECARKINCCIKDGGFCTKELQNIFGTPDNESIMNEYSASEAIEEIRQYEQKSKETELKDAINTFAAEGGYTIESIYNVIEGMRK